MILVYLISVFRIWDHDILRISQTRNIVLGISMRYSDELLQGYPWDILGYPEILKVVQGVGFLDKTAQLVYFL